MISPVIGDPYGCPRHRRVEMMAKLSTSNKLSIFNRNFLTCWILKLYGKNVRVARASMLVHNKASSQRTQFVRNWLFWWKVRHNYNIHIVQLHTSPQHSHTQTHARYNITFEAIYKAVTRPYTQHIIRELYGWFPSSSRKCYTYKPYKNINLLSLEAQHMTAAWPAAAALLFLNHTVVRSHGSHGGRKVVMHELLVSASGGNL